MIVNPHGSPTSPDSCPVVQHLAPFTISSSFASSPMKMHDMFVFCVLCFVFCVSHVRHFFWSSNDQ